MTLLSERIQIDDARDVVTIDGCNINSAGLDMFVRPTPPGVWFRVHSIDDARIMYMTKTDADYKSIMQEP